MIAACVIELTSAPAYESVQALPVNASDSELNYYYLIETMHMGHAMSERLYDFTLSGVVPCVKSGMARLRAKQMRGYG